MKHLVLALLSISSVVCAMDYQQNEPLNEDERGSYKTVDRKARRQKDNSANRLKKIRQQQRFLKPENE